MDELLHEFLAETFESLETVNRELVRFEKDASDRAALDKVFRLVHTIKGACGFLGLSRLEALTHAGETVLGQFRDGTVPVAPVAVTFILRLADRIKEIVDGLAARGSEPDGDDRALIADLLSLGAGGARPAKLKSANGRTHGLPEGPIVTVQSVRVNLAQLERMMTLVGELVLTRNQALQIARGQTNNALQGVVQRLSTITSDLQDSVIKTRMQPIGQAWAKLPRLVRDLAAELGKQINIEMTGAETELDRQVLELIRDPMMHLVRNSADHGLESADERIAAGKPATGRISLRAHHEAGHIIIDVSDDGRGLSIERIRAQALKRGICREAELDHMSAQQIGRLIFQPGFSTAENVTAVSGRGVGLDVVRTNVEQIGGTVDVSSVPGRGTEFQIKIPLTLAIMGALIVKVCNERFAIPQTAVAEVVRVRPGKAHKIEYIHNAPVLRLRRKLLPLIDLANVLGLIEGGAQRPIGKDIYVVVVQAGGQTFGAIVDRVCDTEEIVVTPSASVLRGVTAFSGNTILGDGSVIMIIDPSGIAPSIAGIGARAQFEQPSDEDAPASDDSKMPLLIFRAGGPDLKAIPVSLVTRLEKISTASMETSDGLHLVNYRGRLMPIVHADEGTELMPRECQPALVFSHGERIAALAVDEIIDITSETLEIDCASTTPGTIGSAMIRGRATSVLDVGHHMSRIHPDWIAYMASQGEARGSGRLLLVDDSVFFVDLLSPLLGAAGYKVTAVSNASDALRLKDRGVRFDVVVSEIEMPGMDGLRLASTIRADARWKDTRLIAFTSSWDEGMRQRGREAGFEDVIAKSERDRLLSALSSGGLGKAAQT